MFDYRKGITVIALFGLWARSADAASRPATRFARAAASDTVPVVPLSSADNVVGFLRNVPGAHQRIRRVIRDIHAWQAFWDSATVRTLYPVTPARPLAPAVDFGREMLIVASDGMRRNYDEISVIGVDATKDSLIAHVRLRVNLSKGCQLESLWAPMSIVRVPLDSRPVRFVDTVIDERCSERDH